MVIKFIVLIFMVALVSLACGANDGVLRSGKSTPAPRNPDENSVATELAAMQTADFRYVFVLKRKDGGPMEAADRAVIRANTGAANRRVAADNERAFVIGSNAEIPAANMTALVDYFVVEDHSPPPQVNTNATVPK